MSEAVKRKLVEAREENTRIRTRSSRSTETISDFCKDHYDVVRGARGLPGYIKANLRPIIVNHLLSNPNDKGTFIITYNKESKVFEEEFRND